MKTTTKPPLSVGELCYVVNLETRCVLTYRDGVRISYASKELAQSHAAKAQQELGVPCGTLPVYGNTAGLGREVAPWLVKHWAI